LPINHRVDNDTETAYCKQSGFELCQVAGYKTVQLTSTIYRV
jgi:hypothetical protein